MASETPQLLKIEEAAKALRIGRSKAYEMVANGSLPGVIRIGRSVRVSAKGLADWIERNASSPDAA